MSGLPGPLRALLDAMPDATIVTSEDGRIVAANALVEKVFGYPREELVGQPVEMLVPERFRRAHAADRRAYEEEPRTRPMGEGRELVGRRKDGSEFPVEISLSPMRTEEGTFIVSITRDTTRRREAEMKFRGLLESAPDGIVVVDGEGTIVIVNGQAERMFGYRRDEMLGRPVELLVPQRYRRQHVPDRELYAKSPVTRPMGVGRELMGQRKDGTLFPVEISLSPLETGEGRLVTSIVRDIGERLEGERLRREAEAAAERERLRARQAEEAVRQRDEFLAVASHELRTPVTALQLHLQTLAGRREGVDEKTAEKIRRALRSSERIAVLVERLLDVARLSAGQLELRPAPVRLDDVVRETADRLRGQAAEAGCPLEVESEADLEGRWDRTRIEQVLTNLLSNAFKFGAGRPVEVRARRAGAAFELAVVDHGPGIPRGDMQRIFERFERASPVHHYGGLGLGLYISRQIVAAHGGTIGVTPTEGGGATFVVVLPPEVPASEALKEEVS